MRTFAGMTENAYKKLAGYILPTEFNDYFEVVDVTEDMSGFEQLLHIYLDELDIAPDGRTDLSPNGFYDEVRINDFPIRDHRTILHIRRRRWKDTEGKSVSRNWELVAKGTRHSKEFALFLKEYYYCPLKIFETGEN
jgi:hypothetical protein